MASEPPETADKLRQLLFELYVSAMLWQDRLSADEQERLLDTVLAAAEGEPFELLGLPFPRDANAPARAPSPLHERVRHFAESHQVKRSEAIRMLVEVGLDQLELDLD